MSSRDRAHPPAHSAEAADRHSGAGGADLPSIPSLHQAHRAVFATDLQGNITGCNQGIELLGYSAEELTGRKISAFCATERQSGDFKHFLLTALEKGSFDGELRCRTKSGRETHVRLSVILLRGAGAVPAGLVVSASEIEKAKIADQTREQTLPHRNETASSAAAVPRGGREIGGKEFIIASPIMHKFMGLVDRVAGHTETVLVVGETGTGKELVARTIHESSHRCANAFVDINCAALPEHLVESELFGYEKGAFSGADSSKAGLFELADRGTIFLDEIGELQTHVQVKLLRVLDGAPYYRLGGHRKITVDVRVVAATNQDLELAVKEGRFRKDLYHRLSQFQLRVPPLRERPEDTAALARHFLHLKAPDMTFAADALLELQNYSWPGNVRELRNAVAKLAMASPEPQIAGSDVLAEISGERQVERSAVVPLGNLENMEEQMIIRALESTGGRRAQAAEQLGISRRTLSRKLREYRIDVPTGEKAEILGTISEEQQKFFRAKVNLTVNLRNAQGKELDVQGVNLSTGGMGIDGVTDPAGFSGLLDLSFVLPDGDTVFVAKARLVWVDAGGRAGARFVVVEPSLFQQLQRWTNRKMQEEGWNLPE